MNAFIKTIAVASALSFVPAVGQAQIKPLEEGMVLAKRSGKKKAQRKLSRAQQLHLKLGKLKKAYRLGNISKRAMWVELSKMHRLGSFLTLEDRASLLQLQAHMLYEGGFPIVASIYASQALRIAKNPEARELLPAWTILRRVSQKHAIQNLIEVLAQKIPLKKSTAPVFGEDWHYFVGNAAMRNDDVKGAMAAYGKIKVENRYFFPAKYQQAMVAVRYDKMDKAKTYLKSILYPTAQSISPLNVSERAKMTDYAYMAMGRILYEEKEFVESAKMYRSVDRTSLNFYDSLFEQSWAFFMGGYPNHALGALHAAESPFFPDVYNPEAPILRAMVHYWLCRYDDSRNALADFMETYADSVERLEGFLDRKRLDPEASYQLFENLVAGVSSESLGIPRGVLQTAAEKDSMLLIRDQYASVLEEKQRLAAGGIFKTKKGLAKPVEYIDRWAGALRKDVGRKFQRELMSMKQDFDRLYAQAQFLYVELLMSEKEQLLGKELHAASKITNVSDRMKVNGWGKKTQSWKGSTIGEFWWDEVGYYIYRVDSKCSL